MRFARYAHAGTSAGIPVGPSGGTIRDAVLGLDGRLRDLPPGPIRLTRDMFVSHIKGNSMEPLIPDGGLCAFKSNVSEPYDGKILLMEDYGEIGGNRYSVKRYRVSGNADPAGDATPGWLHQRFTLESLNTDFAPMEIASARKVHVIGEFVFTVPEEITQT